MYKIISETIQEFNGERFYLCGKYFQRKGVRLHRYTWEYFHGPIPAFHDVHHLDGDRANNQIENLMLMAESDHLRLHNSSPEKIENSRRAIKFAIAAAPAWHKSQEGHDWHKDHYDKVKERLHERVEHKCGYCGKVFLGPRFSQFCSNNCKSYSRRDSGIDNIMRKCLECGKEFEINKYTRGKFCGRSCAGKNSSRVRALRRNGGCVLPESA